MSSAHIAVLAECVGLGAHGLRRARWEVEEVEAEVSAVEVDWLSVWGNGPMLTPLGGASRPRSASRKIPTSTARSVRSSSQSIRSSAKVRVFGFPQNSLGGSQWRE